VERAAARGGIAIWGPIVVNEKGHQLGGHNEKKQKSVSVVVEKTTYRKESLDSAHLPRF